MVVIGTTGDCTSFRESQSDVCLGIWEQSVHQSILQVICQRTYSWGPSNSEASSQVGFTFSNVYLPVVAHCFLSKVNVYISLFSIFHHTLECLI